jgi:hypothetical protein
MSRCLAGWLWGVVALISLSITAAVAQPPAAQPPAAEAEDGAEAKLPTIADEPKTIDPAASMPRELAVAATHEFTDSSLREVVAWLQQEQKLVVLLDNAALANIGLSPAEPISDRLDNAPLYLLLNRLRSLGLAWYYEDKILHITSAEVAEERATTLPYNVGDLIDAGYDPEGLIDVITTTIAPDCWEDVGGPAGGISTIGDVLFLRQTDSLQREVQGLLAALRGHGRQTFVSDPPQHLALREKLNQNLAVEFLDTPLEAAIAQLADAAKADIRLDRPALRANRIREREPVTLKLTDRKLETVIQALVLDLKLTWILRDGVLWITTAEEAEAFLKTAVYDVRDLCRDEGEMDALIDALTSQTEPDSWEDVGGPGAIDSGKPGTLVILQQERIHRKVLELLETYRAALRASKPRKRGGQDENEVVTTYYRMHAEVAHDLSTLLPKLVRPDSWKSEALPQAPGELLLAASQPEFTNVDALSGIQSSGQAPTMVSLPQAVLIVRQTRAAHDEIAEVIRRVEAGDVLEFGAGLGGMGGFGGGFFSIPSDDRSSPPR